MQMLYNSASFVVVQFDPPTPADDARESRGGRGQRSAATATT